MGIPQRQMTRVVAAGARERMGGHAHQIGVSAAALAAGRPPPGRSRAKAVGRGRLSGGRRGASGRALRPPSSGQG